MKLESIQKGNSVSIQVRRGDFVGDDDLDICTMKYYSKAIKYLQERYSNLEFYLFSNDIHYLQTNFTFLDDSYIVDNSNEKHSDYFDLFLMTKTKHNIISNSSFGWWGAWLNQNPQKTVIVPEKWRGTDKYFANPDFVYPPEWIKLPIE
jgi:hypothetical protein